MSRFAYVIVVCTLAVGVSGFAQAPTSQIAQADNTQVNKRDRNGGGPTSDQQKGNASDVEITRQIRRSITEDKGLSTYARNIKIITQDGNVILRGPVRSEEEKKAVEAKANGVAGAGHVKSEIQIAEKQTERKK